LPGHRRYRRPQLPTLLVCHAGRCARGSECCLGFIARADAAGLFAHQRRRPVSGNDRKPQLCRRSRYFAFGGRLCSGNLGDITRRAGGDARWPKTWHDKFAADLTGLSCTAVGNGDRADAEPLLRFWRERQTQQVSFVDNRLGH
jgi:hypothetical protein